MQIFSIRTNEIILAALVVIGAAVKRYFWLTRWQFA